MKKIIALLFLSGMAHAGTLTIYPPVSGAVSPDTIVLDTATLGPVPDGGSSPIAWNHIVGSVTRPFIMVGCSTAFDVGTVAATVGGNAMTRSTGTTDNSFPFQTHVFTYPNPSTGVNAISVSWTNGGSNSRMLCGSVSLAGVTASSPVEVSTGSYSGNGSVTATLTTVTDSDSLIGVVNDNGSSSQLGVPTAGQTAILYMPGTSNGFSLYISSRAAGTAGAHSDTWTSLGGPAQESYIAIKPGP